MHRVACYDDGKTIMLEEKNEYQSSDIAGMSLTKEEAAFLVKALEKDECATIENEDGIVKFKINRNTITVTQTFSVPTSKELVDCLKKWASE